MEPASSLAFGPHSRASGTVAVKAEDPTPANAASLGAAMHDGKHGFHASSGGGSGGDGRGGPGPAAAAPQSPTVSGLTQFHSAGV